MSAPHVGPRHEATRLPDIAEGRLKRQEHACKESTSKASTCQAAWSGRAKTPDVARFTAASGAGRQV